MKVQESKENYLEAILVLSKRNGFVRAVDIANHLEFSKPSVSVAMSNLKQEELIYLDEGGGIHLTEAGLARAEQVYERHLLLTRYFVSLGVDEETAADDACRIEHVISQVSFDKIKEHMRQHHVID